MHLREIELLTRSHHPKIKLTESKAKREQGKVIHEVKTHATCYKLFKIEEFKSIKICTDNWFN